MVDPFVIRRKFLLRSADFLLPERTVQASEEHEVTLRVPGKRVKRFTAETQDPRVL